MVDTAIKDGLPASPAQGADLFPISRSGAKNILTVDDLLDYISENFTGEAASVSFDDTFLQTGASNVQDVINRTTSLDAVVVNQLSDFPAPSASVITLETNKIYLISGMINIGTNRIDINGSFGIFGFTQNRDGIIYTGTGNMFTTVSGENFDARNITINCPNGSVIDAVGDGLVDVVRFNFCTFKNILNMGNVENVAFFQFNSCFSPGVTNGFTFTGINNGRFNVTGCSILDTTNTFLELGVAVFQNYTISGNQSIVTPLGGTFLSGAVASANVAVRGIIDSNAFSGDGDVLSGITVQDQLWTSSGNFGLAPTRTQAEIYVSIPDITTISIINTPVLVAGTYSEITANCFTTTSAGRATYDGADPVQVSVSVAINAEMVSGGSKEVNFYVAKNGVAIATSGMGNTLENNLLKFTGTIALVSLVTSDYLEVFVENTSDITNIQANKLILTITT